MGVNSLYVAPYSSSNQDEDALQVLAFCLCEVTLESGHFSLIRLVWANTFTAGKARAFQTSTEHQLARTNQGLCYFLTAASQEAREVSSLCSDWI